MKIFKLLASALCSLLLVFMLASCGEVEVKLTLTADKTLAFPTETVTLTTDVKADKEGTYDVSYEILSGKEYASVSEEGILIISETATNGGSVVIVSKYEEAVSNEVKITIGIKVSSVVAKTSKTTLHSGNAVSLNAEVLPANATNPKVAWEIVEGSDLCVISGNVLIVNDNVGEDEIIKVKAVAGGVSSNVLEFKINPFILDVKLSLTSDKLKAYAGDVVTFTTNVTANSEEYDEITYEIVEGKDLASIDQGGQLTINSDANNGGKIVVVSKSGDFTSNKVEIELGIKVTSVDASAENLNVTEGDTVELSATINPENADEKTVNWTITEGAEYVTLAGNILIIKDEIGENVVVKVKATCDGVDSEEITINVSPKEVPVNLVLTADKTFAFPGDVVTLQTSHNLKDDISADITYEIVEGADLATVDNTGKLTIKSDKNEGGKITVVSKYNNYVSNEVEVELGINVTSITASANKTELGSGTPVTLKAVVLPENATNKDVTWTVLEGADICELSGNVLIVNDGIKELSTIKVQATSGNVNSNILEFKVNPDIVEINLVLSSDKTLAFPSEKVTFTTQVKSSEVVSESVTYEITEGTELATIDENGLLTINATSVNGGTVVVVSKLRDSVSNEIEITIGINVTKIEASASKTEVFGNEAVTLKATVLPENATNKDVTWEIVEGESLCELNGNVLIVNSDVKKAGVIKVKALCGGAESEVLTINVKVNLSLTLEADKTSAYPNENVQFTTTVTPEGEHSVEYTIVSGSELATIDENGLLTIKETATTGGTVIVESKVGEYVSNKVGIQINIKVTSVTISSQKESLLAGTSLPLSCVILPANATNKDITWTIVEGSDLAIIDGNTFTVLEGTKSDSVIKVKATVDGVESNVLTFIVEKTQEELNAEKLMLSLNNSEITIDKNGSTTTKLSASIYNGNLQQVTDKNVTFEIIEGAEYVTINKTGNECSFVAIGHGVATVKVTIEGTDVSETANINAIVPPTALSLHEVFTQRPGYNYNYSKVDELPFPVTPLGTNVCQDYVVTFKDSNNNTGDAVAEYNYETGKITFNSTGLVTVSVTSTSGSMLEATNSYTFNVNEGINIETFEELRTLLHGTGAKYNGEVLNIVVLEKPVGNYDYEYGYDLVPAFALKAKSEQSIAQVYDAQGSIFVYEKGLHLNGNNHGFDGSQVRVLTKSEIETYCNEAGLSVNYKGWPMLYLYPNHEGDPNNEVEGTYQVNIYDVTFKGNCSVSFGAESGKGEDLNGSDPVGTYQIGLQIGSSKSYDRYYVDMDNVTSTGFDMGVLFSHVIDGNVRNLTVDNCFSNGIQCDSNIMTFTDITLGKCGATGIEAGPDNSNNAGINFDQNQVITLAGHINTNNYNGGNTVYMVNYNTGVNYTVAEIIAGAISEYFKTEDQLSNVKNSNGEFVFVSFIFNSLTLGEAGVNYSTIQYKDIDGSGIIHASNVSGINTTHKYIEIDVNISGVGSLGKAILYNLNYGKTQE